MEYNFQIMMVSCSRPGHVRSPANLLVVCNTSSYIDFLEPQGKLRGSQLWIALTTRAKEVTNVKRNGRGVVNFDLIVYLGENTSLRMKGAQGKNGEI